MFAAPADRAGSESAHHAAPVFAAGSYGPRPDLPAVLDALPFGLVVLGPDQELRHENSVCRNITGRGIAEEGGFEAWLSALCPEADHRANVVAAWREKIWRTQRTLTFTLRTADQKPKEIEFRSSLLPDGGISIILEDVTARARSQKTSKIGALKFRALFSHTRTGTVLVDRSGRIIEANPAFLALSGNSLGELRLTTFVGLLHPDEAEALSADEVALLDSPAKKGGREVRAVERKVWLRTKSGERRLRLLSCPIGDAGAPPTAVLYMFEPPRDEGEGEGERLRTKLKTMARKAQALLNSVPDLVLLLDGRGVVVDFAPPPGTWSELVPDDSWRDRPASEVWPVLGSLLDRCSRQILEGGTVVAAEIRGPGGEGFEFSVNLSACGDGQILAVVRNQSDLCAARERGFWHDAVFGGAPLGMLRLDPGGRVAEANAAAAALLGRHGDGLAGRELSPILESALPAGATAEFLALEKDGEPRGSLVFLKESPPASPPPKNPPRASFRTILPDPSSPGVPLSSVRLGDGGTPAPGCPGRERRQHGFRNQLQLVTSVFSLEPQSAPAREAFLKWQLRLRAIALACPYDDTPAVAILPLLRDLADEVCSLLGRGPGRREVAVAGDEALSFDASVAGPFSLLLGEVMRLVLAARQRGPGPSLHIRVEVGADGGFALTVRPGEGRSFVFDDRDAEIETLELLTEQIEARLQPTDPAHPSKEWVLIVPPTGF